MSVSFERAVQAAKLAFDQSDFAKAGYILSQLVMRFPKHPAFNYMLGICLFKVGKLNDALMHLNRATVAEPNNVGYLNALGSVQLEAAMTSAAIETFQTLLALDPSFAGAHNNLGVAHKLEQNIGLALEHYERAVQMNPTYGDAWNNLGILLSDIGHINEADAAFLRAIESENCRSKAWSNRLLNANYADFLSVQEVFELHREYGRVLKEASGFADTLKLRPIDTTQAIRIAYLSRDFREHSVAYFVEAVLKNHDRSQFQVVCLYDDAEQDRFTARLKSYDLEFVQVQGLSDQALAKRIRELEIDVLIELGGHTKGSRMPLLANRVAPIQISWLGYPNTTGLDTVDYRIVDAYTDPSAWCQNWMVETPLHLPKSFICYSGDMQLPVNHADASEVSAANEVVFGSFNALSKLSDTTISLWARLLLRCDGARLVLKNGSLDSAYVQAQVRSKFEANGVSSDRLVFKATNTDYSEHMREYEHIDIALDTYPYHGTTTTFEALWMGVPVLSLCGDRHAARVGHSILNNIGLSALSCQTEDAFLDAAESLVNSPMRRAELRQDLRHMVQTSSAGNAERFTQEFEMALLSAIERKASEAV